MLIPFIGGAYKNTFTSIDTQECINWYLEFLPTKEGAKSNFVLRPTPGLKRFVTSKYPGKVRGLYSSSTERLFAIIGKTLVEISKNGKEIFRGEIDTKDGPISFSDNGDGNTRGRGLIFVDGANGYMLNLTTNVLTKITDVSFPASSHIVFINGYFIATELTSTRAWISNPYNGMDWGDVVATSFTSSQVQLINTEQTIITVTGLQQLDKTNILIYNNYGWAYGRVLLYDDLTGETKVSISSWFGKDSLTNCNITFYGESTKFIIAEGSPDYLKAIATIHNELWLFGDQTTEVFADYGGNIGDFRRIHGAFLNNGTVAKYSVSTNGSNVFWLGSSAAGHGQVWTATGYQPQKISTNTIDQMIEAIDDITDAIGMCYTSNGHEFYVITFPSGNKTFCFDMSTGEWHERLYWNPKAGEYERHKMNCLVFYNGSNYVGDKNTGVIYELDNETFTDDGDLIRRVRTGQHIHNERMRIHFREFEIDMERGSGLDGSAQGNDPQVMMQFSNDGGKTWSNENWVTSGKIGKHKTRIHWHRLGMARDRIFKIVVTDPTKVALIAARADIEVKKRG